MISIPGERRLLVKTACDDPFPFGDEFSQSSGGAGLGVGMHPVIGKVVGDTMKTVFFAGLQPEVEIHGITERCVEIAQLAKDLRSEKNRWLRWTEMRLPVSQQRSVGDGRRM